MELTKQEYRHMALMAAIVAVVPLIFYPHSLGLKLNLSPLLFLVLELTFYWAIFGLFMKAASARDVFISGTICFFGRLAVGVVFAILLMAMHATGVGEAFAAGIYRYKPAMLLQVVSFPFILMPILRGLLGSKPARKTRMVIQSADTVLAEPETQIKPEADLKERRIIGIKAVMAEKPFTGFEEALKYVGELSAVNFALLIDSRGLPVAFHGDNLSLRNLWSAIGVYIVDKLAEPLRRAGEFKFESMELTLDVYRVHIVKVEELFLFVAADRESGETEKVRVVQAANMIRKIYQERYSIKPDINAREESYVPSFS